MRRGSLVVGVNRLGLRSLDHEGVARCLRDTFMNGVSVRVFCWPVMVLLFCVFVRTLSSDHAFSSDVFDCTSDGSILSRKQSS